MLVFDDRGRLVHDGSIEVPGFGQPMATRSLPRPRWRRRWWCKSPKVLDNTMPIMVGNQRIGGVRVGMALDEVQQREQAANATLGERLQQVGSRHLGWLLLMLSLLVVIGVVVILYVQRTLVAPIRDLAAAARRIEAGDYQAPLAENTRNDEVGELVRGFARMRDSIARHDREVRRMAYTDALTGLTNRLAFREALDHRLMAARIQSSAGPAVRRYRRLQASTIPSATRPVTKRCCSSHSASGARLPKREAMRRCWPASAATSS